MIIDVHKYLSLLAIVLFFFRKDKQVAIEDIIYIVKNGSALYGVITIFSLYLILPFTIPYTIKHIISKWNKN